MSDINFSIYGLDINKRLFEIFRESKDGFDTFKKTTELLKLVHQITLENEYRKVYDDVLTPLMNSINNAGCEERRSSQIDFLYKKQDEYGKYFD